MPKTRRIQVGTGAGTLAHSPWGPQEVIEAASRAEEEGYDFLTLDDRVLWRHPTMDPLVMMGTMLARTKRIRVGAVLLIPLRHPTITAKMVATLDRISDGRVLLLPAVGGDYPDEFESCGIKVRERAGRTDEALEIMRLLWTGDKVNFQGRYYRIKDATMQPTPVQAGGPPFWLAHRGRSDASTRRTAKLCQGWYASWVSPGRFQREWKRTLEHAEELGRDPSTLTPAAMVRIYVADNREEAVRRTTANRTEVYGHAGDPGLVEHLQCLGAPEECAEKLQAYLDAGVTHINIAVPAPREEREEQMKTIIREVLPKVGITLGASPK